MSVPMRRAAQAVPEEECAGILAESRRGVLSVIDDDGSPYGVPVNFYYDRDERTVYIHGAKRGHKIDCISADPRVCFTAWGGDTRDEGDWAFRVTGVIVKGRAEVVDDPETVAEKVRAIGLKYYPDPDDVEREIAAAVHMVGLIAVRAEEITGKRVLEK